MIGLLQRIFACLLFLNCAYGQDYTIAVPKAFRIGATEKVVLNFHGYNRATVSAYLQDLPNRDKTFSQVDDIVLDANTINLPLELELTVSAADINHFRAQQKVALVIEVIDSDSDFTKNLEVLVSKKSGYIFVITDRPVYKPGDAANIKVFPLEQSMDQDTSTLVTITVKTPDVEGIPGIGVSKKHRSLFPGDHFIEDTYEIPENPEFGIWKVVVQYFAEGYETTAETSFDVKRYVLPTFQVTVEMDKPFILVRDRVISGTIRAQYSYGEPVSGNYYMSMKLLKTPGSTPTEIYRIPRDFFLISMFRGGSANFEVSLTDAVANDLDEGEDLSTLAASEATIFVEATVNGAASGVLESAKSAEIPFVTSPYRITTERTSTYFTPRLAYRLRIDVVQSVGGKPARNVPIQINVVGEDRDHETESNERGQINFQLDFAGEMPKTIRVKTTDPDLINEDQASIELQILPYSSQNNRYLQISSENNLYQVNSNIQLTFRFNEDSLTEIRYYVLARGSIVHNGFNRVRAGNDESSQTIQVTQKMVPSARVVAYYMKNGEVVSNSFWFDVEDQCKEDLIIRVPEEATPGQRFNIDIEGARNSLVSISAVDRASYFLYNKDRLTRQKMFDKMEGYDQGCVRNGGGDGPGVFLEAGLTLTSRSNNQQTVDTLECDAEGEGRRKKRQADEAQETATLNQREEEYIIAKLEECRMHGESPRKSPQDTCEIRAERVRQNFDEFIRHCSLVFLQSCKEAEREWRRFNHRRVGRSNNNPGDVARSVAKLRVNFQESLTFTDIRLNDEGFGSSPQNAQDSITTFEFDAVGMQNAEDGFCVAETANMRVFKDAFIKLYTPYSLRKLEQANLKISVFNYNRQDGIRVKVQVRPEDDSVLCTHFPAGEWNTLITFEVESRSASSTTVTVLPLKIPEEGKTSISIRIVNIQNERTLDYIKKEILIEERGEVKDIYQSYPIDLRNDRRQTFDMEIRFPESFVQNTRLCKLYAYANFLGPSIEVDPITQKPNNIDGIFRMPFGCGEQTMLISGPNVYAHMYLDSVGRMEPGSPAFAASVQRIESGYARELSFRSNPVQKRAFAVWYTYPPSTWLNAFVDKVFTKAKEYDTDLDIGPICRSLDWLLTQQVDGTYFDEKRPPFHREMHGAVGGHLTLTAYVVISLLETQSRCLPELNLRVQTAATNAVNYLRANKDALTFRRRPYALALLSYTLALHEPNSAVAREIFGRLLRTASSENGNVYWVGRAASDIAGTDLHAYWYNRRPQAVSIEATAYALLAQIAMVRFENPVPQSAIDRARKIALWLIGQRNEGGAFLSTQDTVIGLQALATYGTWTAAIDTGPLVTDFSLQFTAPGTVWEDPGHQISLDDDNIGYRKTVEVPSDVFSKTTRISVTAIGSGEGVLSYRCLYRTIQEEDACHFEIDYDIEITNEDDVMRDETLPLKIKITLTVSKPRGPPTEMTIVEVGLLSGFVPIDQSIAQWAIPNVVDGLVDRYDITNVNVVLYFRTIGANATVINFDMEQTVRVRRPQPAKINVYDYYEPSVRCGTFYTLPQNTPDIRTANCRRQQNNNDEAPLSEEDRRREAALCKCAEGGCLTCRSREEQLNRTECLGERRGKKCATCGGGDCHNAFVRTCASNYAYLVNVTSVDRPLDGDLFYKIFGDVVVVKQGDDADVANSQRAEFVVRRDCYERCIDEALQNDARVGQNPVYAIEEHAMLFIIGNTPVRFVDRVGNPKYEYRLDETSLVERYIPPTTCNNARVRYRRSGLKCTKKRMKKNKRRTPKQQAKCDKWKKIKAACKNFEELQRQVNEGCD